MVEVMDAVELTTVPRAESASPSTAGGSWADRVLVSGVAP